MHIIQTDRLCLMALSYNHLSLLVQSREKLETELGLNPSCLEVAEDPSFMKEFEFAIANFVMKAVKSNFENYLWFTHWLIIEKSTNVTVGGIGASGLPDQEGSSIVGYFIGRKHEGKGYASEAVEAFKNWMFQNPMLQRILADTPISNIASQKVLQKSGFKFWGEVEEGLRWSMPKS